MITTDKMSGCLTPRSLKQSEMVVPCGSCSTCIKSRIDQWSVRLFYEEKVSSIPLFVTLTYANDYLPRSPNNYATLDKAELQRFIKRLRMQMQRYDKKHKQKPRNLRYFACGEYGGKYGRPHYHLILFNATYDEIETNWTSTETGEALGAPYYGNVTSNSISYVAKYMQKPKLQRMHARDDREEQFFLYSKGLGDSYLSVRNVLWHREGLQNRYYINKEGYANTMPKSWKNKIFSPEAKAVIGEYFRDIVKSKTNYKFVEPNELSAHRLHRARRITTL